MNEEFRDKLGNLAEILSCLKFSDGDIYYDNVLIAKKNDHSSDYASLGFNSPRYRFWANSWNMFSEICSAIYEGNVSGGVGDLIYNQQNQVQYPYTPSITNATITPFSSLQKGVSPSVVEVMALYSQFAVFTLPVVLQTTGTSYSNAGGWIQFPFSSIRNLLEYNKLYESLVKRGNCLFLPQKIVSKFETTWDYSIEEYEAPLIQSPETILYNPVNSTREKFGLSNFEEVIILKNIFLPYFPGAKLDDILKITKNETDAFVKFNYYLSQKISTLEKAESTNVIRDILREIEYEVANLRIESERISKLKVLQGIQLAFFTFSLSAIVFSNIELVKQVAGVVGSINLLELIKSFASQKNEGFELKKSDFYLPYLILTNDLLSDKKRKRWPFNK